MKLYRVIVILYHCFAVTPLLVRSQQPRAQDSRPTTTIRIDTDLVMIDVTVTDKNGDDVRDLRSEEFQVFEDGQRRKIDFFSVNDESMLTRPLAAVFALDLSGSLKPDEIITLHSAAMKFTGLIRANSVPHYTIVRSVAVCGSTAANSTKSLSVRQWNRRCASRNISVSITRKGMTMMTTIGVVTVITSASVDRSSAISSTSTDPSD
jgi:hypothetical protein